MIEVRDVFQLKFGKAREATELFQEGLSLMRAGGASSEMRILNDVTGPYYTLVLESTYDSLATYEAEMRRETSTRAWKEWYSRVTPLVDSGRREIFNVVGSAIVAPSYTTKEAREPVASRR